MTKHSITAAKYIPSCNANIDRLCLYHKCTQTKWSKVQYDQTTICPCSYV